MTLFVLYVSHFTFAQDPRLLENNWYLTNVIKDSNNHYPVVQSGVVFSLEQPTFRAYGCLSIIGEVTFENNFSNFSITNLLPCLCWCTNPAADAYDGLYFSFFSDAGNFDPQNVTYFTYAITELGNDERSLIITSSLNDQAIYTNVLLSNPEFDHFSLSLYPNPATDFIVIDLKNKKTENTKVEIYNELGIICKSVNLNSEGKIDTKDLTSGVYFVKIKMDNELITKKMLKM